MSKSHAKLADALVGMGHTISPNTVAKLLVEELEFSRKVNRKTVEGTSHPDRNASCRRRASAMVEHINAQVLAAQAAGQPVISVDTKKKELIGNYKNGGSDYREEGEPDPVDVHDFPGPLGKGVPYGVLDLSANLGWVSVVRQHAIRMTSPVKPANLQCSRSAPGWSGWGDSATRTCAS